MTTSESCFILIRGLLREQRHWGEFIGHLESQFPDARMITLDIPGNGQLHQQTSPSSIPDYTEALRNQLAEKINLNIIALSMGGMIAMDWMIRYPMEIKSSILINSSVRPYSAFFQRLKWQAYPTIAKMIFASPEEMEQHILSLTSNQHCDDQSLLESWLTWRQQNPVSKKNASKQLLAAAKFSVQAKPLHPLLIVAAKNDRLVDYHCSLKLHQLWHTDYLQHESAGHDIPLDNPQWLSREIRQWMHGLNGY